MDHIKEAQEFLNTKVENKDELIKMLLEEAKHLQFVSDMDDRASDYFLQYP